VVCSNCGSENPAANRFCGMCGTPLPQRPITAPDAQSTLSFTRLPSGTSLQAGSTLRENGRSLSSTTIEEKPSPEDVPSSRAEAASSATTEVFPDSISTSQTAAVPTAQGSSAPAAYAGTDYFAEAENAESLEQFIAGFHYTPPSEEEELTMTGDKPVLDSTAKYEPVAPIALSEVQPATASPPAKEEVIAAEPPAKVDDHILTTPPPMAMPKKPSAPRGAAAEATSRPGFLDITEPPRKEDPAPSRTSIGGPSFLGLNDPAPAVASGELQQPARRSHWRAWLTVVVVLVFAALGLLEWRAEKRHLANGPLGVVKMQIERLKGKKGAVVTPVNPAGASPEGTPPSSTPAAQPDNPDQNMQVTPQPQPQKKAPAPNPGDKPTSPSPGAASNTLPHNVPAQTQPAASAPGAEEVAKANSASDGAAAAAWLWKAVGRGNPEAPVRLADMYLKGDGVPRDCAQALVLLRAAAANQNAAARSRLGTLYATGTCVARDRVRAYEYMSSAVEANPNAVWARNFRQQLWSQMTPQERNLAQKYR